MRRNWKRNYWIMLLPLLLAIIAVAIHYTGLTINITPSMRIGLYAKSDGVIAEGDVVSLCLTEPYKTIALERGYVGEGRQCSGADSLIKEVIALPGDDVILADDYITVNQHKYFFKTQRVDSHNRKLNAYPRGRYLNTAGFWVIGVNNKSSWDSRYFGPISSKQILTKLKPLAVW